MEVGLGFSVWPQSLDMSLKVVLHLPAASDRSSAEVMIVPARLCQPSRPCAAKPCWAPVGRLPGGMPAPPAAPRPPLPRSRAAFAFFLFPASAEPPLACFAPFPPYSPVWRHAPPLRHADSAAALGEPHGAAARDPPLPPPSQREPGRPTDTPHTACCPMTQETALECLSGHSLGLGLLGAADSLEAVDHFPCIADELEEQAKQLEEGW